MFTQFYCGPCKGSTRSAMSCRCKNSVPELKCREDAEIVFTAANGAKNQILSFRQSDKGFSFITATPTGGNGTGGSLDPLGSQGSLILSPDRNWLLCVNAGPRSSVSVFKAKEKPELCSNTPMTAIGTPVSVTMFRDLVFVLNSGAATLEGFKFNRGCLKSYTIVGIPEGGYGQVSFTPCGKNLVITSKTNNQIIVIPIDKDGMAGTPVINKSNGVQPFGLAFSEKFLLVAEATTGAVSSYSINPDGTLTVISGSVTNGQKATCWIVQKKGFIVTSNPGSSTLSTYTVDKNGVVTLLNGAAVTGLVSTIDLAFGYKFLYAVDPGAGQIDGVWHSKVAITSPTLIPIFAQGLAVL